MNDNFNFMVDEAYDMLENNIVEHNLILPKINP